MVFKLQQHTFIFSRYSWPKPHWSVAALWNSDGASHFNDLGGKVWEGAQLWKQNIIIPFQVQNFQLTKGISSGRYRPKGQGSHHLCVIRFNIETPHKFLCWFSCLISCIHMRQLKVGSESVCCEVHCRHFHVLILCIHKMAQDDLFGALSFLHRI